MAIKHIGRIKGNKRKVIVAYRVVPGEPESCLVVQTENLDASEHDALIKAVESSAGQEAYEFGEAMARTQLPDGRNMLAGFHTTGKIRKWPTNEIEMTPDTRSSIMLDELNKMLAEQKGVGVEDLALQGSDRERAAKDVKEEQNTIVEDLASVQTIESPTDGVISDEDLAAQYRSQADAMYKEAKRLREQAEELVPTKRKTTAKKKESA